MENILEDVKNLFNSYRNLYSDHLFLEQTIVENLPQQEYANNPQQAPAVVHESNGPPVLQAGPLQEFYNEIKNCTDCALGDTRTKFVFGVGNPDARLMFVGEAPGRDEDLKGEPFVGRAGQLLDLMLHAIHIKRPEVYIANVLKCRPPDNRDPKPDEIEKCEPYLLKQIELIKPEVLVALGRYAATLLLRINESLGSMRGKVHRYNNIPLIVTYHPAALLRSPQWKAKAWEDLKHVSALLNKTD